MKKLWTKLGNILCAAGFHNYEIIESRFDGFGNIEYRKVCTKCRNSVRGYF